MQGMVSVNPFAVFKESCQNALTNALDTLFPEVAVSLVFELPQNPEFGELSSSVCFVLAKQLGKKPLSLAKQIVEAVDLQSFPLIREAKAAGNGYVNFPLLSPLE